jgi:hypothetical protein
MVVGGLVGLEVYVTRLLECTPECIIVTLPFTYEQLLARQSVGLSDMSRTGKRRFASMTDGEIVIQSAIKVL